MATVTEEEKRARAVPGLQGMGAVNVAAPLNLTAPGTMAPDKPAPIQTQPAPKVVLGNAGRRYEFEPTPTAAPKPAQGFQTNRFGTPEAISPAATQGLANQSAMYVQGAQATAAARPPVSPVTTAASAAVPAASQLPAAHPQGMADVTGRASVPAAAQMAASSMPAPGVAAPAVAPQAAPVTGGGGEFPDQVVAPSVNPLSRVAESVGRGFNNVMFGGKTRAEYYGTPSQQPVPTGGDIVTGANAAPAPAPIQIAPSAGVTRPAAPVTPPVAPATTPQPAGFTQVGDGVFRRGNTFTDAAGTQDAAFNNRGPVSRQSDVAATNLATRSTAQAVAEASQSSRGFSPAGASAPQQFNRAAEIAAINSLSSPQGIMLRNLKFDADNEAQAMRTAGSGWRGGSPAADAYRAALGELTTGTREGQTAEMRNATDMATTGMREAGATRRAGMTNAVEQGDLGLRREAQGFTSRAAARMEKAQADYMGADTPEKKAAAAKVIRELQGKEKSGTWKGIALQGGTDALGNRTEGVLAAVNDETGEMRQFDGGAAPRGGTPAYEEGQLLRGKDGKTYIVRDGQPVLAK